MLTLLLEYCSACVFIAPIPCSADMEPRWDAGDASSNNIPTQLKNLHTDKLIDERFQRVFNFSCVRIRDDIQMQIS